MVRTCRVCKCTDTSPCVIDGHPCHWVAPECCSACSHDAPIEPRPGMTVVDAKIIDVSIMAGGALETTIEGTLDDGRTFTGIWPGEWHVIEPPTTKESDGDPLPEGS